MYQHEGLTDWLLVSKQMEKLWASYVPRHIAPLFYYHIASHTFSRNPIFEDGPSAKISRSDFRGWTFYNFSTHS